MRPPGWWNWPYGFRLWLFGWLLVIGLIALLVVKLA
jgi:hypothetical protein